VGGEGRARGARQLTLSKGPERMGIRHHGKGPTSKYSM
jgi:hypothetical protein